MATMSYRNPYTIGGWVRGRRYYGHADLRQYILLGSDNFIWLIGARRVGKTSLLRQLDLQGRKAYLPIYWDMQGCITADDIRDELIFALEDRQAQLERLGIDLDRIAQEDAANVLRKVCRGAEEKGVRILLLIDEPESLIAIAQETPEALQRLRAAFQRPANLRVVLASTKALAKLHEISQDWLTSPLLNNFAPLYLDGMTDEEAGDLIRQSQRRPVQVSANAVRRIRDYTGDHPYLLQWLCYHLYRPDHSLRLPRKEDILVDAALQSLFRIQFQQLSATERKILLYLSSKPDDVTGVARALRIPESDLRIYLHIMYGLGYLRTSDQGGMTIGNRFFHRWLAENIHHLSTKNADVSDSSVQQMARAGIDEEAVYWKEQLRIYRERLGKLEVAAARHGGQPPERLQQTIREHKRRIRALERKIDAFHLTYS